MKPHFIFPSSAPLGSMLRWPPRRHGLLYALLLPWPRLERYCKKLALLILLHT